MDFSKPRMAVLRVIYFAIIAAILIVAKVELGFSDGVFAAAIIASLAVVAASYPLQLKLIYSVAHKRRELGPESMIGLEGSAIEEIGESGRVRVRGETWKARTTSGPIGKGDDIVVVSVENGLTLLVERTASGTR